MYNTESVNQASFAYSLNLLKILFSMQLITKDEYNRIAAISAEHYGTEFYYV